MIISGEQLTAPLGWRGERGGERELSLASNGQACLCGLSMNISKQSMIDVSFGKFCLSGSVFQICCLPDQRIKNLSLTWMILTTLQKVLLIVH